LRVHPPRITALIEEIGGLIDRAAFDADAWEDVMVAFAAAVPGGKTGFQVVDVSGERAIPLLASGWPDGVVAAYAEYFNTINPWMPVMLAAQPMRPIFSERALPASQFAHTEFYTDWLSRAGGADASTGMRFSELDGRLGFISLHYEHRRADAANAVYEPLLDSLGSRMRRALDAGRGLKTRHLNGPLLDALVEPALLLGRDLRIHGANAAADALLRDGAVLRCGARDHLDVRDPDLLRCIAGVVAKACDPEHPVGPSVEASGVATAAGSFLPCVMPVDPAFLRAGRMGPLVLPSRLALLVLRRCAPARSPADLRDALRTAYGLTPAEARLAAALDGSASLKDVADRFGITSMTARTQLRAIFRKTNTARQAELVRLILKEAGPAGR
jgi:DNA-binding CsgD family transcriptional regulator